MAKFFEMLPYPKPSYLELNKPVKYESWPHEYIHCIIFDYSEIGFRIYTATQIGEQRFVSSVDLIRDSRLFIETIGYQIEEINKKIDKYNRDNA